jgi:hypothetical protein
METQGQGAFCDYETVVEMLLRNRTPFFSKIGSDVVKVCSFGTGTCLMKINEPHGLNCPPLCLTRASRPPFAPHHGRNASPRPTASGAIAAARAATAVSGDGPLPAWLVGTPTPPAVVDPQFLSPSTFSLSRGVFPASLGRIQSAFSSASPCCGARLGKFMAARSDSTRRPDGRHRRGGEQWSSDSGDGGGGRSSSSGIQTADTRGGLGAGEAKGATGETDLEEEGDVRARRRVWRRGVQDRSCSLATGGTPAAVGVGEGARAKRLQKNNDWNQVQHGAT